MHRVAGFAFMSVSRIAPAPSDDPAAHVEMAQVLHSAFSIQSPDAWPTLVDALEEVAGLLGPDANGRGKPDILMSKRLG